MIEVSVKTLRCVDPQVHQQLTFRDSTLEQATRHSHDFGDSEELEFFFRVV